MLFTDLIVTSKNGYHVPNFSGKSFEVFISNLLESGKHSLDQRHAPIFTALSLKQINYEIGTYWKPGSTQIDLVVHSKEDREIRIIECKWIATTPGVSTEYVKEVSQKKFPNIPKDWSRSNWLVLSQKPTKALLEDAEEKGVKVLTLSDLFEA